MNATLGLLLAVAGLGAFDTFWHHEWRARLPFRPGAQRELRLHAGRDFVYGVLFMVLGWGRPTGVFAWVVCVLLLFEIVVTLLDFVEEDRHRPLDAGERVTHTLIAIVYGAFLANLLPRLWTWSGRRTEYEVDGYGGWSWLFTAMAVGVVLSGGRDLLAARALDVR